MDIYQRLTQDHDRHRDLAIRIAETSGASAERRELWERFSTDCEAHANAEEQTLYAALIRQAKGQEEARHSVSEHKTAAELIEELNELDMASGGWLNKFNKLKAELEHHMDEEEQEVFVLAKRLIDHVMARELVPVFEERKSSEK